uniref:Uncharacterized protein n=1 Tax=Rhizophora mucronata TaxID=61149 RepID=A0A2P2N456_RHIMU
MLQFISKKTVSVHQLLILISL